MIFNKQRRIKYLGFNDVWFMVIGIFILSLITDFLFNSNSFTRFPLRYALINWGISLFYSTCDWFILRTVMILLRKRYPNIKDDAKRITVFFFSIISVVILMDYLGGQLFEVIFTEANYDYHMRPKILVPVILISTMTFAIYEAVYFYIRLKKSIRKEEQAKRAIVQAQLDTLTNQARPHFLFNSLNALRSIIDENSKEDAKQFVDKIAEVYRFILDAGNVTLTPLQDELKFARSYIHIQKERFGENLKLDWNIPQNSLSKMVVPMSLQLLLENAIKHNVVSKAKPLTITVGVTDQHLIVSNKTQPKSTKLPSTKVGLKNIKKRYRLISDMTPKIVDQGEHFVVSLPLLNPSEQNNTHAHTHH